MQYVIVFMGRYRGSAGKLAPGDEGYRHTRTKLTNACAARFNLRSSVKTVNDEDGNSRETVVWRVFKVHNVHGCVLAKSDRALRSTLNNEEVGELYEGRKAGVPTSALIQLLQGRYVYWAYIY